MNTKSQFFAITFGACSVFWPLRADSTIEFAVTHLVLSELDARAGASTIAIRVDPPLEESVGVSVVRIGGTAQPGYEGYDLNPRCNGCDYTLLFISASGTVTDLPTVRFPARAGEATFTIYPKDDGLSEGDETIVLGLTNLSPGLVLGSRSNLLITLRNSGPTVELSGEGGLEAEFGGHLQFRRSGDTNIETEVSYHVSGGTALPGLDFHRELTGTVAFAPGERQQDLTFDTRDWLLDSARWEWLTIQMTEVSAGVKLSNRELLLEIWDAQIPANLDLSYRLPLQDRVLSFTQQSGTNGAIAVSLESGRLLLLRADGSFDRELPYLGNYPSLAWRADGNLLVVGESFDRLLLSRILPDGLLESQIEVPTSFKLQWGMGVMVTTNGSIYLVDFDGFLRRLTPNGTEDPSFPKLWVNWTLPLALDERNRLLVRSWSDARGQPREGLARLNPDGSLDSTFERVFDDELGGPIQIQKVLIQPDAKLLLAGNFEAASSGLIRLNPNGSVDKWFERPSNLGLSDFFVPALTIANDGALWKASRNHGLYQFSTNGSVLRSVPVLMEFDGHPPNLLELKITPQGQAMIAGSFHSVNGSPRPGIARLLLDPVPRTALSFASTVSEAVPWEIDRSYTLRLRRVGDVNAAASVYFSTRDGTARAGKDYEETHGVLQFAPFVEFAEIVIPLMNDTELEGDESFEIVLSDATGVEVLGPSLEIVIIDDEVGFLPDAVHRRADGTVELTYIAPSDGFRVQVSTDLAHWTNLNGALEATGHTTWKRIDQEAADAPQRYYRVIRPAGLARDRVRPNF